MKMRVFAPRLLLLLIVTAPLAFTFPFLQYSINSGSLPTFLSRLIKKPQPAMSGYKTVGYFTNWVCLHCPGHWSCVLIVLLSRRAFMAVTTSLKTSQLTILPISCVSIVHRRPGVRTVNPDVHRRCFCQYQTRERGSVRVSFPSSIPKRD